jgi:hypothetical protein
MLVATIIQAVSAPSILSVYAKAGETHAVPMTPATVQAAPTFLIMNLPPALR